MPHVRRVEQTHRTDPVALPISIGPKNSAELTGHEWRYWREHAAEFGLTICHVGTKPCIRAAEITAYLDRLAAAQPPPREPTDAEERAAILTRLGLEQRA